MRYFIYEILIVVFITRVIKLIRVSKHDNLKVIWLESYRPKTCYTSHLESLMEIMLQKKKYNKIK